MSKESISFLCQELKKNIKNWGSLSSKWVVPFSEIMDKWADSKSENDLISSVSEWVAVSERLPDDDINVLCYHNSGNYFICYRTKDCITDEPKWFGGAMPDYWKPLEPPCR